MKTNLFLLFASFLTISGLLGQEKKDILLTIDDKPIYAKEFKQVYKKNLDLVQEENQKTVDGYLDLFVDYKLKVAEAYAQNLDERESYIRDFSKYEEQLSRNYIYEDQVTGNLVREAYERGKEEIHASHILIMCNFDAIAQDTLAAYNKIERIRKRALAGEDFATLASTTSEEPGAKEKKGDLGYFSAFDMVYTFENVAYATPVGEISEIVRTQFGYHIIKIHDRREKLPPVAVAHIMISTKDDSVGIESKKRIDDIYAQILQGEKFEDLAKQYSDDKGTAMKGGKMRDFSRGDLNAPPFENMSYALENPGDISEPVQTRFGWHIIKLLKKLERKPFSEKRMEIERKVKSGDRSKIVTNAVTEQLKEKLNVVEGTSYAPYFKTYVTDSVLSGDWKYTPVPNADNKIIFTVGTRKVDFEEFAQYINKRQGKVRPHRQKMNLLSTIFDEFETKVLKEYFRETLEKENDEYASIIREYRDGLLIFEVMSDNVWNKAKLDSVGQEAFFAKNRSNYLWKQRATIESYAATSAKLAKQIQQLLKEGKSVEEVKETINKDDKVYVIVTEGTFEEGAKELPDGFKFEEGISDTYMMNNAHVIIKVKEVLAPGPKELDDVRGRVMSDYQNYLETEWMQSLKEKYTVEVNKKVLKRIKKELDS
ncbi:MAG: peptidylprolyl isomerase [Flavobacteriaceae bacterium]|nr:peptidylprolyl isomerase [Flavobacteriaceae bacterium]